MTQENVEIVRRSAEEFNRGGVDAVIDTYWAPEIVWDMTNAGVPGVGVYTGYDEIRAVMADWFSAFNFDEWELEVEELIDCDNRVVSMVRQRGRGTSSGAEVSVEFAQVVTLSGGKIVRVDNYLDRGHALEAAGLSE
jgi:ketosteroid isomerase-like protein